MSDLRSRFEEMPIISEYITNMKFNEDLNKYECSMIRFSEFVNGAWMMFQELNK